jgi:hypothetical protein
MVGRGDDTAARAATDETEHEPLLERLRDLAWPTAEPGQAERAFERFRATLETDDPES